MVCIKKIKGFRVVEAWFHEPERLKKYKYLYCSYYGMSEKYCLKRGEHLLSETISTTLISDLTNEDILGNFEGNVRNEVRRAKKDGTECRQYTSAELSADPTLIDDFEKEYAEMHRLKNMPHQSSQAYLRELARNNALVISVAYIDQMPVVYHVYIVESTNSRFLYSVSVFRSAEENSVRNAIGRANRLLHYEDMLWLRKRRVISYDWGGYGQSAEVKSISNFKKGFGGSVCEKYYVKFTYYWFVPLLWKLFKLS